MTSEVRPYELTFEKRPGYLYAHMTAATTNEATSRVYLAETAEKCRELGYDRLMIYRNIPVVLTTTAMYFAATMVRDILGGVRTAFVNPYAANEEMLTFAATVAKNYGEAHGIFSDVDEAERWLLSK